jgi:hypothetical protein
MDDHADWRLAVFERWLLHDQHFALLHERVWAAVCVDGLGFGRQVSTLG